MISDCRRYSTDEDGLAYIEQMIHEDRCVLNIFKLVEFMKNSKKPRHPEIEPIKNPTA